MSEFQKTPKYLEDEPREYSSFSGGINNDTDNENIMDHELRDAVNTHYNNGNLERRPGAVLVKDLEFIDIHPNEHKNVIQGAFNYVTGDNHYLVVIRDGFIYYSAYGENEKLSMVKLHIQVDTTKDLYDPLNLVIGLEQYTGETRPDFLLDHDGFILNQSSTYATDEDQADLWGDSELEYYSAIVEPEFDRLILQNYKKVQGAIFDDILYLATGTRFIKMVEVELSGETFLAAAIVEPKIINGFEYTQIGYNILSPFPNQLMASTKELATSRINFVKVTEQFLFLGTKIMEVEAILDFNIGKDKDDYSFQWEYKIDDAAWVVHTTFELGAGKDKVTMDLSAETILIDTVVKVRCTYTSELTDAFAIDKTFAEYGSFITGIQIAAGLIADYVFIPNQHFIDIHSCNKMFTDGVQIILYGSTYKTGNWFKTIKYEYDYVTIKNSLNFQTNKNERIVAALPLEGNIIVFADNPQLGGSIHKVYGNGDDYDAGDGFFSPYRKKVVNTALSCDHPGSVQFVDNFLMFKYRNQVYMIDSRELNADRLNVTAMSDNIIHNQPGIEIPEIGFYEGYEFDVISEITDSYYGIIFPKSNLRWKMYYKMPFRYQGTDKTFYPWLRDESEHLAIDGVVVINNIPTHIIDGKLLQYTNLVCVDLDETFKTKFLTKAYRISEIGGLVKFINSLLLKFYRGSTDTLSLDVQVFNEANRKLLGAKFESFYDDEIGQVVWDNPSSYYKELTDETDRASLILDKTTLEDVKLGSHLYSSKVYRPDLRFPCLSAYVVIQIDSAEAFSLSSMTFDYTTTDLPARNLPKIYSEIIRKDDVYVDKE